MTTKELLKMFIDQALLFHTDDWVTKAIGIGTWLALAMVAGAVYIMVNMLI